MISDLDRDPDPGKHLDLLTLDNLGTKTPYRQAPDLPMSNWILSQFPPGYEGHAAEVGASDGRYVSPTWALEWQARWTVLCVEANPLIRPLLASERSFVECCAVGSADADGVDFHVHLDNLESFSALNPSRDRPRPSAKWKTLKVNVRTLESILEKWQFRALDALCIDVEGGERDVLKGFNLEKWKPRVIVVESWEQGALDPILRTTYERVRRSADNDCYLRRG